MTITGEMIEAMALAAINYQRATINDPPLTMEVFKGPGTEGSFALYTTVIRAALTAVAPLIASQVRAATIEECEKAFVEFNKHKNWSLSFKRPVYCDDDDQESCWIVTEVRGSINDREWHVIGKGETPEQAVNATIRALTNEASHDGV